ncbi:MAG: adenylate/guanylate cyclase domain-containing protein [Spirochaetales bacterium]|nr:adenylate/guanylate cyclase domain-containing protein [Spirochaetales bacterium]
MKNTDVILEKAAEMNAALSKENNTFELIRILVTRSMDISRSELAGIYIYPENNGNAQLIYKRGKHPIPTELEKTSELINFTDDCSQAVVLLNRKKSPFSEVLLNKNMKSGIILPLISETKRLGYLVLNSDIDNFYTGSRFKILESTAEYSSGLIANSLQFENLQKQIKKLESIGRYQDSIFTSLSDILITATAGKKIRFFNDAASIKLGLTQKDEGKALSAFFKDKLSPKTLEIITSSCGTEKSVLGLEITLNTSLGKIDYSLDMTPLKGKHGGKPGATLLFKDKSAGTVIKNHTNLATENQRTIKDMFSKYLSKDLIDSLIENPELVLPGGAEKNATVFYANIRDCSAFSKEQKPEYVIERLNKYFQTATKIIIKNGGYVDKFSGDSIMAAWGVPLSEEKNDAVKAVKCAIELQQLIKENEKDLLENNEKPLKVGIGIHSGPLVAGNIGIADKMNYTIVGNTVTMAAQIEKFAEADEIIISDTTRKMLGNNFELEQRKPVNINGNNHPIEIYNVTEPLSKLK